MPRSYVLGRQRHWSPRDCRRELYRRLLIPLLTASAPLLGGCGDETETEPVPEPVWLDDVEKDLPLTLSEVGVLGDLGALKLSDRVTGYEPNWPLWSSGSEKSRAVYVPTGSAIDTSNNEGWQFPVGTVLAKTFAFEGTPVETRLLFRRETKWDYAVYQWREGEAEADLLDGNWLEVPLEVDSKGDTFTYKIPARLDCRTCHETSEETTGTPVLGLTTYQLPDSMQDHAAFKGAALTPVDGRTQAETKALGYFIGNCISCHDGGDAENSSFSLFPDFAIDNTVDQPTESETAEGIRVVPGSPETSVVFIAVVEAAKPTYDGPFKQMPPVGVALGDPDAAEILGEWIEEL